jgi:transcriptional regulator of nitric oxide reductase
MPFEMFKVNKEHFHALMLMIHPHNKNKRSTTQYNAIGHNCASWNNLMRSGVLRKLNLTLPNTARYCPS